MVVDMIDQNWNILFYEKKENFESYNTTIYLRDWPFIQLQKYLNKDSCLTAVFHLWPKSVFSYFFSLELYLEQQDELAFDPALF